MKYLKPYKLFENVGDMVQDIKDIFLELEDIGLHVFVVSIPMGNINNARINIEINTNQNRRLTGKFKITEEIADVIYRCDQFVRSSDWRFCAQYLVLGGDEEYQISGDDIYQFVGREVWVVNFIITDPPRVINEGIEEGLDTYDSGVIERTKEDIQVVNDILLEMSDLGYWTNCDFTPMTHAGASKSPEIWVSIKDISTRKYSHITTTHKMNKNIGHSELWLETISRIKEYLSSRGWESSFEYNPDGISTSPKHGIEAETQVKFRRKN